MSKSECEVTSTSEQRVPEVDRVKKYDTVVSSGQSALRALLTMNGGAIIVFLTFLGQWNKDALPPLGMRTVVVAVAWFISGIVLALVAYCSIFVTNCFSSVNWPRSSNAALVVTFVGGFGSLVCFPIGCWRAIDAFRGAIALLAR